MNFNNWSGTTQNEHSKTIKPGLTARIFNQSFVSAGPINLLRRVIVVRSELLADVLGFCQDFLQPKGFRFDGQAKDVSGANNFYFSKEII